MANNEHSQPRALPASDQEIARKRCGFPWGNWMVGALLITGGTLLFLDNLGIVSMAQVWQYWPLIFVAFGFSKLNRRNNAGDTVLGVAFIALGALFVLVNTGAIPVRTHDRTWPLSVLLILFGILALQRALNPASGIGSRARAWRRNQPGPTFELSTTGKLDGWVFAGNLKRRIENTEFRGGVLNCVMGEAVMDLRTAQPAADREPMIVQANCVLGAIRFRIPQDWAVSMQGSGLFGAFEDKTIPVRPLAGVEPPLLIVMGGAVFGAVEVDN